MISFSVTVANTRGTPIPTGTVQIKDANTNTVVGLGTLGILGTVTINTTLSNGSIEAYAFYPGVVNQFGASQSPDPVLYSVTIIDTTASVTTTAGSYFCYHQPFTISAHVAPNSGLSTPTGNVTFNLYSDASSFVTIGSAALNGSGNASIAIPADTTTPGNDYYIQVIYTGSGCFGPTSTVAGTGGVVIHSVGAGAETTVTATSISGSSNFCIHNATTFIATVSPTYFVAPSSGSVTWTASSGPTTITLGTDSTVVGGAASINVPGDTFPFVGSWSVHATYTGDGFCYANSTSPNISVTPSLFGVSMLYSSGSTNFCYATSQNYFYNVSSSNPGTISGTFTLVSSVSGTVATVVSSGPHTGFSVGFTIPPFTLSDGSQTLHAHFVPSGTSCYGVSDSSNLSISVKSLYSPQYPSSTQLLVSPSSGYTYTTFNFTINVFKGSGVGPLDGAGSLNGSATLYVNYQDGGGWRVVNSNIHIYDFGTYGTGTYSSSGFSASNALFSARWNGNLCYNYQDSPNVNVSIQTVIY